MVRRQCLCRPDAWNIWQYGEEHPKRTWALHDEHVASEDLHHPRRFLLRLDGKCHECHEPSGIRPAGSLDRPWPRRKHHEYESAFASDRTGSEAEVLRPITSDGSAWRPILHAEPQ